MRKFEFHADTLMALSSLQVMADIKSSVLINLFTSGNKKFKVIFHKGTIAWSLSPFSEQHTVKIENVLSVQHSYLKASHPLAECKADPFVFTIHYAEPNKRKWKYKKLELQHTDSFQVSSWIKTLQNELQRLTHRPKKLLLFVNPFCGRRNAMKIYERYGKPLFSVANVDVTVNVSQRKDQIRDYVLDHSLDLFDAVACVGGDGTVSELFNGLVLRECRKLGVDVDDIEQELPKPKIPIGIIPGGSTDTIVHCMHGTTDPTTAVLNVIFGDRLGLDLVSVYNESSLLQLYASVLSYGFLGDVAYHSVRHLWMGPSRYSYSGFKKLVGNKAYEGEVAFYSSNKSSQVEMLKCYENCDRCIMSGKRNSECDKAESQWRTVNGKFFMISGANISCACSRAANGIAPFGHLGDGNVHLVLVKHTSVLNNLRLLLNLSSGKQTLDHLPFVQTHCVKEFCFRAINVPSRWNCDGEVQQHVNIRAKVRCQLLTMLSRSFPKPQDDDGSGCCGF